MRGMSPAPQQQADAEYEAELAQQTKIAEEVAAEEATSTEPQVAGEPAEETGIVEERPKVVLAPVGDDIEYPLTLSVVGAPEGGFVFDGPDSRIEVDAEVGEQVTYVTSVNVEDAE